jgi:hypothetical protein
MEQDKSISKIFETPLMVLSANALILAAIAYKFGALVAAKILFIEVSLILGLICVVITICHKAIHNDLTDLELHAVEGRDEAALLLRQGRASLYNIRQRLEGALHPEPEDHLADLLSNVAPLVGLFLKKEKSLFRWGMFGWKIVSNAAQLMSQRNKNS